MRDKKKMPNPHMGAEIMAGGPVSEGIRVWDSGRKQKYFDPRDPRNAREPGCGLLSFNVFDVFRK